MSAGKFWILVVLSLMVSVLVILEVICDAQVARVTDAVAFEQASLGRMQRSQELLRQMLQKLALDSVNDPAVADLLQDHGVHIHRGTDPSAPAAPAPAGSKPAAPDVPPVAQ
jgi:hypothetical protein